MDFLGFVLLMHLFPLRLFAIEYRWMNKSLHDGLTDNEKQFLLDVHNYYRSVVAGKGGLHGTMPQAANMRELTWNDQLANDAQRWSEHCTNSFGHGVMHNPIEENGYSGQNYMGEPDRKIVFKTAMEAWADDEEHKYPWGGKDYVTYGSGHYTQIMWAHSDELGCGFSMCNGYNRGRLICHFMPAGNYDELSVYERGPPCSKCDPGFGFCKKNLCAKSCPEGGCKCTVDWDQCHKNGGTYDYNHCLCRCPSGKNGLNCEKPCKDKPGVYCDENHCRPRSEFYHQLEAFCPSMCHKCIGGCKDKRKDCKHIAKNNQCKTAFLWMKFVCPETCNHCHD